MCAWNVVAPDGTKSVKANDAILQANTTYITAKMNIEHQWAIGADEDGRHTTISMPNQAAAPLAVPASAKGILYALENVDSQLFYKNANGIMQLLGIKACALFNYVAGDDAVQTLVYSYNVASVVKGGSTALYTITYTDALPTNNYMVWGGGIRNKNNATDAAKGVQVSVQGSLAVNTVKSTALCKVVTNSQDGNVIDPLQTWVVCFGG